MAPRRDPHVRFHPAVTEWFAETFAAPTKAQRLCWAAIAKGESALVFAPTGSGKTLAAFLAALDRLMFAPVPPRAERGRIVYVSPPQALAGGVGRDLRPPAEEREPILRPPPDILITTPESLFLVLTSRARAFLASVEAVIVDEIHALVGTKRGAHLALSLERLQEAAGRRLQRIGLSATQRPLEEVARYLGGGEGLRTWKPRPVAIVDAGGEEGFDLRVEV